MKNKGLQKLRWYCQMCQKQCRDQNGFKCHLMSESHQRQLLLFGEDPGQFLDEYSKDFEKHFMDILKRQYNTKRVLANVVYNDYIKDRHHIHMNSTKWYTLTGFVQYLGRSGQCKIDHNEKGWYITYIDHAEEERRAKEAKKSKMDKDDEERIQELVMKQAERAREQQKEAATTSQQSYTEFQKGNGDEKIGFSLGGENRKTMANEGGDEPLQQSTLTKPADIFTKTEDGDGRKRKGAEDSEEKMEKKKKLLGQLKTTLEQMKEAEEAQKEARNRKDYWLCEGIIVKVTTKKLGDKFYKQKGEVVELVDRYTALVKLVNGKEKLKLDQTHVETVIPAIGKQVLIVNGAYRGTRAILMELKEKRFCVTVRLDEGPARGRVVDRVKYEDVCKVLTE